MCKIKRIKIKLVIWIVLISFLVIGGGFLIANHVITNVQARREIERNNYERILYLSEQFAPVFKGLLKQNREYLDVLVSGELIERGAFTRRTTGWRLFFNEQGAERFVYFDYFRGMNNLDELLWLSPDEEYALMHLPGWWDFSFRNSEYIFIPSINFIFEFRPEYLAQVSRDAQRGVGPIVIEYNPNIVEAMHVERRVVCEHRHPNRYRYIYRSHLEDAYFMRFEREFFIRPIDMVFIRQIISVALILGFFFTIGAFWTKNDLRNAKKEAEDESKTP